MDTRNEAKSWSLDAGKHSTIVNASIIQTFDDNRFNVCLELKSSVFYYQFQICCCYLLEY